MNELGESLLKLLQSQRAKIRSKFEVDLQVCVIIAEGSTSDHVYLKNDTPGSTDSITVSAYKTVTGAGVNERSHTVSFDNASEVACVVPGGILGFTEHLISEDCAHHVIFDCTGEEAVGKLHAEWLNTGVNVVTANNWGLAGPREQRDAIAAAEKAHGKLSAQYMREVTVGGALPVINTARNLLNSGDKIRRIDGIISVSMSYILFRISPPLGADINSQFDEVISKGAFHGDISLSPSVHVGEACSFSQAVEEAVALGLMEEDPVKDLNNDYSSRCLMCLAKELGLDHQTSYEAIHDASERLVEDVDFSKITPEIEKKVHEKVKAAQERGCVLRHIASIDVSQGMIEMRLVEVPNTHIFAVTPPSCECVRFFTERHLRYPLIIQGPSAGADSTASGLLAEFLSHMRSKVGPRSGTISRPTSMNHFPQTS
jgi:aspartokinase/homoserine dehydrogenase 1